MPPTEPYEEVHYQNYDFHQRETYNNPDPSVGYQRFVDFNQRNFPVFTVSGNLNGSLGDFYRLRGDHRTIHVFKEQSPPPQATAILARRIIEQARDQQDVRILSFVRYKGKKQLGTLVTKERLLKLDENQLAAELTKYFRRYKHLIVKQSSVGGPMQRLLKGRNSIL